MIKKIYFKYEEIINYIIIGGFTTLVSLSTYYISVLTILNPDKPTELSIANIISWICAVTFAYFTNKRIVFKRKKQHTLKEISSFYLSRALSLLLDIGIMFVFVNCLHYNDKIIKLVVQVIVTIVNYLVSKLIVFKKEV